jgi:hypothetical protein
MTPTRPDAAVDTSQDRHPNPRKYVRIPFGIRAAPCSVHDRAGRAARFEKPLNATFAWI